MKVLASLALTFFVAATAAAQCHQGAPKTADFLTLPTKGLGCFVTEDTFYLHGPIEHKHRAALEKALVDQPGLRTIVLNSPGGNYDAGLKLGELVLQRGLNTSLPYAQLHCASSCTYVFQAGKRRTAHPDATFHYHGIVLGGPLLGRIFRSHCPEEPLTAECSKELEELHLDAMRGAENVFSNLEQLGLSSRIYEIYLAQPIDPEWIDRGEFTKRPVLRIKAREAIAFNVITEFVTEPMSAVIPVELIDSMFGGGEARSHCQIDDEVFECTIDTGANVSSVRANVFEDYSVTGQSTYTSITGETVSCDNLFVEEITLGSSLLAKPIEIVRCPVRSKEKQKALVGLDVLDQQTLDFKYPDNTITIGDSTPTASSNLLRGRFGHPLLSVTIDSDSNKVMALFDSGAGVTLVSSQYVDEHPDAFTILSEQGSSTTADTHGNPIQNRLVLINQLKIGDQTFSTEYAMAVDFSEIERMTGQRVDLLLGYNIIKQHRWHLNLKDNRWAIY